MSLAEPDDDPVRYDLAGNPMPSAKPPPPGPLAPPPLPRVAGAPPPAFTPPARTASLPSAPTQKPAAGPWLFVGLGVAAAVILAVVLVLALRPKKPVWVPAPASFSTYKALDGSFACDQPAGWKMTDSGTQGGSLAQVAFEQGPVRVRVVSDAAGSLMSESFASSNANLPPEQQVPPVEKLHAMDKPQLANDMPGYQEGTAQKSALPGGDARVSEWTATDHTGHLHGYRVTMLNKDREITVLCFSPEANWSVLQPTFQRIISSITPGTG